MDAEELVTLTLQLRRRLLELDVDDVRLARSDRSAPDATKACCPDGHTFRLRRLGVGHLTDGDRGDPLIPVRAHG
ncbi:hypothetical protein OG226_48995 [Streptomyces sp. NBC_01261]|uniref:hypothetical protein n=1 Tax=Streptomyces sp. NBC_01261 TaxID=2903802 RepID=UPI002E31CFFC|nr:hypothetical protein [Streptomyces sp. NBC_01261]